MIPSSLRDRNVPIWMKRLSKESHQAVEAKEHRRHALDGAIRPLALGFDAQQCPTFLKVTSKLQRFMKSLMICSAVWVGSVEKSAFGGCLPDRSQVAPIGWAKGQGKAIPQCCCRTDLHSPRTLAIPIQGGSARRFVGPVRPVPRKAGACRQHGANQWYALSALEAAHGGPGVQPASRYQAHLLRICVQSQFEDRVAIAHRLDLAVWKPSADETDNLMRPHPDGLVSFA